MHLAGVVEHDVEGIKLLLRVHSDVRLVAGHPVERFGALLALVEPSVSGASATGGHLPESLRFETVRIGGKGKAT